MTLQPDTGDECGRTSCTDCRDAAREQRQRIIGLTAPTEGTVGARTALGGILAAVTLQRLLTALRIDGEGEGMIGREGE